MLIKFVGKKPFQRDTLYETFTEWDGKGDIQNVPDEIAPRLLKHKDCYVEATKDELVALRESVKSLDDESTDESDSSSNTLKSDTGSPEDFTSDERIQQIVGVIKEFDDEDEDLWGTTGKPLVQPIELKLGYDIKASERDEALLSIDAEDETS